MQVRRAELSTSLLKITLACDEIVEDKRGDSKRYQTGLTCSLPLLVLLMCCYLGSWYESNPKLLNKQLNTCINRVLKKRESPDSSHSTDASTTFPVRPTTPPRAIIAPHAGFSYSAQTTAHIYPYLNPNDYDRVFVLGPSHRVYLSDCRVTSFDTLETPLGDLRVNKGLRKTLIQKGIKPWDRDSDEREHSIELCLPWVSKIFESRLDEIEVLTMVVGALDADGEEFYGRLVGEVLEKDKRCLWVVSSDFCHWGARFGFLRWNKEDGAVWKSIETLDKNGMKIIEKGDVEKWQKYLKETRNTICGRHPIGVLLNAIKFWEEADQKEVCVANGVANGLSNGLSSGVMNGIAGGLSQDEKLQNERNGGGTKFETKFVHYTQSSKCTSTDDSSVSYAAAITRPKI